MKILGISCFFHDSAAALLEDGVITAAAEEERFSRKKHDYGFPKNAINFCLKKASAEGKSLDYIVFYEKPFLKFERILKTSLQTFPKSRKAFSESMKTWLLDKLWIKSIICEKTGINPDNVLFCEHHLSHAASAFLCSPFEEAAIITVDGVGEWATTATGMGKDNKITLNNEIKFPHSLGLLYSAFTAFLGFEVNEGEYKVMGMAPYGKPAYADKIYKLIQVNEDGSFILNMDYFCYHYSAEKTYSRQFEELFGVPRDPCTPFFTEGTGFPAYFGEKPTDYKALCEKNSHYADIAASIQFVTEEIMLKMAKHLHKETGMKNLCLAGGVGLNSVANGRILREAGFENIYIQPASGDSGGAVGAALYAWNCALGKPRDFIMEHAYFGEEYRGGEIKTFLEKNNIVYEHFENEEKLLSVVAKEIAEGKVIGWFQGRFEWGPRALGNRSILADPRRAEMKDIVNTKIKFREPYRPFAPSVLVEKSEEYFDLKFPEKHYPSAFMLLVAQVKDEKKKIIPAVTHVDGSARIQAVSEKTNPRYYRLIKKFESITGVPVILNTSFNLKGEPIVSSPEDAYKTFSRSGLDILALGDYLIRKKYCVKSG